MRQIRFNWKYLLAGILLANIIACSNDDLAQMANRQEHDSGTRTAELVTKTITLEVEGTLEAKLSEAMGEEKVSTLEKLIVSGPFTSTDMQYVRDSLTGLMVLDMEGIQIKSSDIQYKYASWSWASFQENQVCDGMFYNMDKLKELVLPSTIVDLGRYAFYNCDSLQSVVLPSGLQTIGEQSFYYCSQLRSILFPSSLKRIGKNAFSHGLIESINIPDSLNTIEEYAFFSCDNLKELVVPETVISLHIGNYAFESCDSLHNIQMLGGVETIGNGTFYYCRSLENVQMLCNVQTIGSEAFRNCSALKKMKLPESVREIGQYAFYSCSKLKALTLPASVKSVGSYFVSNCPELSTLIWNSEYLDVPNNYSVSNCILFVNTDQIAIADINNWKSIVINGFADTTIKLEDGNNDSEYSNCKEFTAKKIVYNRYFGDTTYPGGSSGWQTIVLPFTPDSIYHESKGQIAPFNSGIEGAKPFWLRELTSEGFVDVTKIEANKPYIIAMPNHGDYMEEYCLDGNITFVARDSVFRVTPDILEASIGPDFEFQPTYKYVERSTDVFNLGTVWNYYEEEDMHYSKSFFIKNNNSVSKFNAYVTTLGGGRSSRTMFDLDTRSKETRAAWIPNKTGIPQIGDM